MGALPVSIDPNQYAGSSYNPALADGITAIQTAIVAQLQAAQTGGAAGLAGVEIAAFPDRPKSWRAVSQIGTVLVRYTKSEYQPPDDIGNVVQSRVMHFEIGIAARGLGWSDAAGLGAYPILEAVRLALAGFAPPGCWKMYVVSDEFLERDEQGGIYYFAITFAVPTMAVEQSPSYTLVNLQTAEAKVAVNGTQIDTVTANSADSQSGPIT